MVLADTLSRLPNRERNEEIELDVWIDSTDIHLMNFAQPLQQQMREETGRDPVLQGVAKVIHAGWPDRISELPTNIYFPSTTGSNGMR